MATESQILISSFHIFSNIKVIQLLEVNTRIIEIVTKSHTSSPVR